MRAATGVWWSTHQQILKFRCSEMRFQANPNGTILAKCKMILSCYVRHEEVWQLAELFWDRRLSVHRIFRVNFFAIVHKFVGEKKMVESRGVRIPWTLTPQIRTCYVLSSFQRGVHSYMLNISNFGLTAPVLTFYHSRSTIKMTLSQP
jgi:hypothetical protein